MRSVPVPPMSALAPVADNSMRLPCTSEVALTAACRPSLAISVVLPPVLTTWPSVSVLVLVSLMPVTRMSRPACTSSVPTPPSTTRRTSSPAVTVGASLKIAAASPPSTDLLVEFSTTEPPVPPTVTLPSTLRLALLLRLMVDVVPPANAMPIG